MFRNGGSIRTALLIIATMLLTYAATMYYHQAQWQRLSTLYEIRDHTNFARFIDALNLIDQYYVEDVDPDRLLRGAVEGMIRELGDPYSAYFDEEELEQLQINITGEYEGIGVVITELDGYVTVQTPFPGTPGATTRPAEPGVPPGLQPGDRIIRVDDQDLIGVPVEEAAQRIRGPVGSIVELTVDRPTADGDMIRLHFAVERARIEVPTIDTAMLDDGIGYLRLTSFTRSAGEDVGAAIEELRAAGARALILDLRNNPGGDLHASVAVASHFVPRGPVVHIVQRDEQRQTLSSRSSGLGMPYAVLINGASASASEIVAGAVQDRGDGILVGETSFGKGSVQTIWSFGADGPLPRWEPGAPAGIKLTTALYLTPSGRSIHGEGIEPELVVEVEEPFPFGDPEADPQLKAAIEALQDRLP